MCKTPKEPNFIMKLPISKQNIANRPCQRLCIDLLGQYPRSKNCNFDLLIVLDQLSKFHWICLLGELISVAIMQILQ